jgi:hypothetical protein
MVYIFVKGRWLSSFATNDQPNNESMQHFYAENGSKGLHFCIIVCNCPPLVIGLCLSASVIVCLTIDPFMWDSVIDQSNLVLCSYFIFSLACEWSPVSLCYITLDWKVLAWKNTKLEVFGKLRSTMKICEYGPFCAHSTRPLFACNQIYKCFNCGLIYGGRGVSFKDKSCQ